MKTNLFIFMILMTSGCAMNQGYNPVTASTTTQTFLLNETSLAQVKMGMKQDQVHQIMGEGFVIGYSYQKDFSNQAQMLKETESDYKPLTIANPYRTESVQTKDGEYTVEYYVNSIKQFDGVVSDDELVPLIFQGSILIARGWDRVNALRFKKTS